MSRFSLHHHVQNDLAPYPLNTECKKMGRESDNSPPVSAQLEIA
jgi:hypothetical protein